MLRPCLECGDLSEDARCPEHQRRELPRPNRPTTAQLGYGGKWQRLSRKARRLQPWCSWCLTEDDLTTDHLVWPARSLEDVQVLCRPCNSRKGVLRSSVKAASS